MQLISFVVNYGDMTVCLRLTAKVINQMCWAKFQIQYKTIELDSIELPLDTCVGEFKRTELRIEI